VNRSASKPFEASNQENGKHTHEMAEIRLQFRIKLEKEALSPKILEKSY
jgi:hypothetical protein